MVKVATGAVVAIGAAVGAVAAVLGEVPIPTAADLPAGHTMMDVLALSAIAFIWNQMRLLNKKTEEGIKVEAQGQPKNGTISEFALKQLEKIAFGVEKTADQLTQHRMEFSEFRGNVEARLENLETKQ